ncbi:MAG: LacI family DNA-binding transcriptional regulator [Novosphingobium sp.]|nr:LacI family DNA-binding transcriptional regulator [Novosphingobium sp.]
MLDKADKAPTLDDVATLAGVSSATVSRYLNSPDVVAKATAERIAKAIKEIGYIPNLLAGGLASSRSRQVSVLIPHLSDSIFNETIESMSEELVAGGITVMLGLTGVSAERTAKLIMAALSRRVDAIISTGLLTPEIEDLLRRSKVRFIQIWELPENPIDIAIGFSHREVGRDIARFLRTRGYRLPHIITAEGKRAAQRRDGFVAEWQASGGEVPTEDSVTIPSRFGHARRAFAEMRRLERMPDVVVCGSDHLAQGIIVEAQFAGLRVPEDLAVIGFGNASLAGEMRPTITTVDIDGARIAREAIAAIDRADSGNRIVDVGFRLIARESA